MVHLSSKSSLREHTLLVEETLLEEDEDEEIELLDEEVLIELLEVDG